MNVLSSLRRALSTELATSQIPELVSALPHPYSTLTNLVCSYSKILDSWRFCRCAPFPVSCSFSIMIPRSSALVLTDEFTHIVVLVAYNCIQINVYFLPSGFTTACPEKTGIAGEVAPPAMIPLQLY